MGRVGVLLGLWLLMGLCEKASGQGDPLLERAHRPLRGSLRTERLPSKLLAKDMVFQAYLPPGHDPVKGRYPLVIYLGGFLEGPSRWLRRGAAQSVEDAITAGNIPPCVFVVPEGGDGFWMDSSDGKRPFSQFLEDELIPTAVQRLGGRKDGVAILARETAAAGALELLLNGKGAVGTVLALAPILPEVDLTQGGVIPGGPLHHPFVQRCFERTFGAADGTMPPSRHPLRRGPPVTNKRVRLELRTGHPLSSPAAIKDRWLPRIVARRATVELVEGPSVKETDDPFGDLVPRLRMLLRQ